MTRRKRILLVCNSVFQILVSLHIQRIKYSEYIPSIILSDYLTEREQLLVRFKESGYFEQVYSISIKNYNRNIKKERFPKNIYYSLSASAELKKYIQIYDFYDVLLISNINNYTNLLARALKTDICRSRICNPNLEINLYEDGTISYTPKYEAFYKRYKGKRGLYGNIKKMYLFAPDLYAWNEKLPIEKLDKISMSDGEYITLLNELFGYKKNEEYNSSIIFFEESYYMMGEEIDDLELLNTIAARVPEIKIMVKMHPRTEVDRFGKYGYAVSVNNRIPFELIYLNNEFKDTIFLTVASGSASNCSVIFDTSLKTISLLKCLTKKPSTLSGDLEKCIRAIYERYSNMYMPENIDDVISLLIKGV